VPGLELTILPAAGHLFPFPLTVDVIETLSQFA
jgi:hypothetical protein